MPDSPDSRPDLALQLHPKIRERSTRDNATAARIAQLKVARSQLIHLFAPSDSLTKADRNSYVQATHQLLAITYQDLHLLAEPTRIGIDEFFGYLKDDPDKRVSEYESLGKRHFGSVLPALNPNQRWFVDLEFSNKKVRDPQASQKEKTTLARLFSFLGFDPTIRQDILSNASFLLADASNQAYTNRHDTQSSPGFSITDPTYDNKLTSSSAVDLMGDGHMQGIECAIGIHFEDNGIIKGITSLPDGLGNPQLVHYPFRKLSRAEFRYQAGLFQGFGWNIRQATVIESYKLGTDGFFRRNSFDTADLTIQDEIIQVLDQLPKLDDSLK